MTKTCGWCAGTYSKRPSEAFWQFDERKFCSRPCADKGRRTTRVPNDQFKARYRQVKTPDGRKVLEHRYVMELHLGRPLRPDEHVHHRNGDRLDNRVENLEIVDPVEHARHHAPQKHPTAKACVICEVVFEPHPTKRARQQTCGAKACKSRLLSQRHAERRAS
jgi:hypothetical protein